MFALLITTTMIKTIPTLAIFLSARRFLPPTLIYSIFKVIKKYFDALVSPISDDNIYGRGVLDRSKIHFCTTIVYYV